MFSASTTARGDRVMVITGVIAEQPGMPVSGSTRIYDRGKCTHRVGDIRHRYFSGVCRNYLILKYYGLVVLPTGGVFPHLPHHLDLASEDSVGHSTRMSVLTLKHPQHIALRRACMYCDQHVAAPRQT